MAERQHRGAPARCGRLTVMRLHVLVLARRHDDRINRWMRDQRVIVRGRKLRAALLGDAPCTRAVAIGEREKTHCRVIDRELRAQRADAASADDADAQLGAAQFFLLHFCFSSRRDAARPRLSNVV